MNIEQSEQIPDDFGNVHFIQDTPLYHSRLHEEMQKFNRDMKERQELQDQMAREALREHRLGRIQQLGLHVVRTKKE